MPHLGARGGLHLRGRACGAGPWARLPAVRANAQLSHPGQLSPRRPQASAAARVQRRANGEARRRGVPQRPQHGADQPSSPPREDARRPLLALALRCCQLPRRSGSGCGALLPLVCHVTPCSAGGVQLYVSASVVPLPARKTTVQAAELETARQPRMRVYHRRPLRTRECPAALMPVSLKNPRQLGPPPTGLCLRRLGI